MDVDLKNMVGVVVDHTENQVTILPKDCEINELISFLPS